MVGKDFSRAYQVPVNILIVHVIFISIEQDEKKKKKYRRSLSGGRIEKKPEIKHKISFRKTLNHILRKSRSTSNVTTVSEETTTVR